jgi:Ca-activated chloride channel family protein
MTVKISAQFDNALVSGSSAERYLLVKITGVADSIKQRVPLNLSLVLDRSGSMAGDNKLKLVKEAASFVVERLTEQDRVSVVVYDDTINVIAKSVRATSANRRTISSVIKEIRSGGSTNLGEGWLTGCREVAEYQTEARYVDCAWLLTDGLANVGITNQEELTAHATELRKRGISTTTFGVGLDFNEDLLRALAEKGGGNFYFIDSSKQIKNYFEGELGERLNTVARSLALEVRFSMPRTGAGSSTSTSTGAADKLEGLNDYEATRGEGRLIMQLGDLYAGEEKQVLVKVSLGAGRNGEQVKLSSLLMFTDAQSGLGSEVQGSDGLTLTYTSEQEAAAASISAEMKEIMGKVLGARAKQEILAANKRGDYAEAAAQAQAYRTTTHSTGIADSKEVEAEIASVDSLAQAASAAPLAPKMAKSAHYSSHMATRNRQDYKKEDEK